MCILESFCRFEVRLHVENGFFLKEEEEVADTEELWCHCQEPEYGYISIIY